MSCGIGALVIARNEERNIEDCLRSLAFCDERVVVDSYSSDRTVALASPLAEHIYRRPFVHHAEQKNWGIERLRTPWVLILDADERVGEELAKELQSLAASENPAEGWWLRRRNTFFGRAISGAGWDRDRVLRFFRREAGRYEERFLHEEVTLVEGGRTGVCRSRLLHHSYVDWRSTFERWLSYSTRGARDRARRRRHAGPMSVVFKSVARFLRQYVGQGGLRDGVHGFVLCTWSALGILLREMKLSLGQTAVAVRGGGRTAEQRVEVVQGRLLSVDAVDGEGHGGGRS